MTHRPRNTEQVAAQTVAELHRFVIERLTAIHHLTADQPTTAEIEEAQDVVEDIRFRLLPAMSRALLDWTSARRLVAAHAVGAAAFRAKHPEVAEAIDRAALKREEQAIYAKLLAPQTNSPAEDAAMDQLEARQPKPVSTILDDCLNMVRPRFCSEMDEEAV